MRTITYRHDWAWGDHFEARCDHCGTHCGGSEGQSFREVERPNDELEIICAECDDDERIGTNNPGGNNR
jgi:hypothetical protein